jgi:alkanesulfonate monooxygenase SsuD/methylene tetrahydromethanopterin reductase-like flavin-dependent oxidoreductase (luciferase family)
MTWGGGVFDGVMLHTFFTDQTLRECVDRIRAGAEKAGRDPNLVRVWAVLAVLTDLPEEARLKMLVGRMGTYLQAYGDALVTINGWDPKVLADFRAAPQVLEVSGTIDAVATRSQLEAIAELIPEEWLAASAVGSPDFVASRIEDQLSAGADGVILHASTPDQLTGAVDAYRARRPADRFAGRSANPGR